MHCARAILANAVAAILWSPLTAAQAIYNKPCPLLGPDVPPPTNLSTDAAIATFKQDLLSNIKSTLSTGNNTFGTFDNATTSFSLDIFTTKGSIFTYHYSAPGLAKPTEGVSTVDSNTIYRIGSISKVLTAYLWLISNGDAAFNDPITKYVPELAAYAAQNASALVDDSIDIVDFNEITVGALMSHLGGVARNGAPAPETAAALQQASGLPPTAAPNVSFCGDPDVVRLPCDRASFFQDFFTRHPVAAPFYTPTYSDLSYQLLGYALENITSKSFTTLFNESLLVPLGTNATSYGLPSSNKASIIPGNSSISWYDVNLLDQTPTGGYYSTINDMRRLGISILNSTFLRPAQTRSWMKPVSFTSDSTQSLGRPWEITQAPSDRTSYIYAKAGDIGLYAGELAFLPDYNVGFTVLSAGETTLFNTQILSDMTAALLYPALEAAAKSEANTVYAGTYTSAATNSSITIETDIYPGLHVTNWIFGGADVFPALAAFSNGGTLAQPVASDIQTRLSVRMYPTGLTSFSHGVLTRTGWRIVIETLPARTDPGAFSGNCVSWDVVDDIVYGAIGFDEFAFNLDGYGNAVSIDPRVLQQSPLAKNTSGAGKKGGKAARLFRA